MNDEVQSILRNLLPKEYHYRIPLISALLVSALEESPRQSNQYFNTDPQDFIQIFRLLAGRRLELSSSQITFGSENSIGDIEIRDIAGGNIIHLSVNIFSENDSVRDQLLQETINYESGFRKEKTIKREDKLSGKTIRLIIVDDHRLIVAGLEAFLESIQDFTVVARAHDGLTALKLIRDLKPDVALIDIVMPGIDGISLTKRLNPENNPTAIILLSVLLEERALSRSIDAGIKGYLSKDIDPITLEEAIRHVSGGGYYFSPQIAHIAHKHLERIERRKLLRALAILSDEEMEVVQLLAEGSSRQEISRRLKRRVTTINKYISVISTKLGISNEEQIVEVYHNARSLWQADH